MKTLNIKVQDSEAYTLKWALIKAMEKTNSDHKYNILNGIYEQIVASEPSEETEECALGGVGGSAFDKASLVSKLKKVKEDQAFKGVITHGYPPELSEVIDALEGVY